MDRALAERDFYTVPDEEDKYVWERYYSNDVEPRMKDIISNIVLKSENIMRMQGSTIIDSNEKHELAELILRQLYRGILIWK